MKTIHPENAGVVSVIIPTYNRALICKVAVESALSQTHANVEVIVIDDGSTDGTREVICGIDNRVKYIYQTNAGVSASRNRGLEAATGDYIAFLDSDDEWLPWKLEAQLSILRSFPEVGMVWTDMKAVDENSTILHESYRKLMYGAYKYFDCDIHFSAWKSLSDVWDGCPTIYANKKCYSGNIFSWMFMGNLVHTSTVLLRRERQMKVGFFDVDLVRSGEDYDFHFRACHEGDVAYLDIPSVLYRVGGADQLTQNKYIIWVARNNLKTVLKMLLVAKDEIALPRRMLRSRLAWSFAWVGFKEFDENRMKLARSYLMKSLTFSLFQIRVAAYLLLSYLPYGTEKKLKRTRDRMRRIKKERE